MSQRVHPMVYRSTPRGVTSGGMGAQTAQDIAWFKVYTLSMDLQGKINTKQAVIGLVGLALSAGLFFYSAMYMNAEGIYSTLAGFALLCLMFSIGYAATGNLITSSVAPFIMFVTFELAGLVPHLSDNSPFKPFLQLVGANGKIIFLLAILAAMMTHKYFASKTTV